MRIFAAIILAAILGQSQTTAPSHALARTYGGMSAAQMRSLSAMLIGTRREITDCLQELGIAYEPSYDTPGIELDTLRDALPHFQIERCDNCDSWFSDDFMLTDEDHTYCEFCGN